MKNQNLLNYKLQKQYKELTLEKIEEALAELVKNTRFTFNLPQGQIGDTGAYRIADNCITGIGGWKMYQKALHEKAQRFINT